jgi:AcrR family transcriptional regulator
MTQPREQKRRFRRAPDEKRARIVAVARACFSERAYEATTTAEIARRAGVSEGTIFHHFGSKPELLRRVAQEYAGELCAAMYGDSEANPASLEQMMARTFAFVREEGMLGLERGHSDALLIVHQAIRHEIIVQGAKMLEAWRARNLVRPMNGELVAELLFPIMNSILIKGFDEGWDNLSPEYLREAALCVEGALRPLDRGH